MSQLSVVFKRELASYFATPLAYVFIVIFLVLAGSFAFFFGGFFQNGQADLKAFFNYHPWLYLFLVPALSMRLWAEERKSGTLELLMTLPISLRDMVLGKYLAAWVFTGIALFLTFPMWFTVNYLGDPDNGVILGSYVGSWFMAGAMLAVGSCISACTKNQVIAFILTVVVCFLMMVSGMDIVMGWVPGWMADWVMESIAALSFLTHFNAFAKGVLDLRDIVYFCIMIVGWLMATAIVIDMKKAS
ncbi:ABC transporter permease subunit [Ketobacter alkanivorans]|uniref:ABC transporter permease n=1 Tax=Ketobacter alkanivorans TaxID=1917421 RepID=A0A2K9LHR1_9GAMM|nr:ABC transporter permease subunit [Ketobacter alkanivorans]AUM11701.1 ABC transporter permease [Ketobacter alkanivorans]MCP5015216.1 ABC transporter permease subunit [Ketobacter sp.]